MESRTQVARFLSEIGVPTGFQGTAVLEAKGGPIVVAGLLVNEGVLSTLPVSETP